MVIFPFGENNHDKKNLPAKVDFFCLLAQENAFIPIYERTEALFLLLRFIKVIVEFCCN